MIRFRFNGQLLDEVPDGWDELDTTVRTDRQLLFLRTVVTDARFTFYRDGYLYLRDLWKNYGATCADVVLTIEEDPTDSQNWRPILRGRVKIPSLRWSAEPDRVSVSVEDLSFYSFLNNNKKIEANPELPKTKNGLPMSPALSTTYDLFDPATGFMTYSGRELYHVDDLMAHLVEFLSDGEVGFRTTAFGPGGRYGGYALQTLYRLRTNLTDQHLLSYTLEELLRELGVNFRAALALEYDGSRPILRLEPEEDLYQAGVGLQLNEVHPITEEYDASKLYGSVRVGSSLTRDQGGVLQFPEEIRWRGFAEEQYYLLGQCNTNAELDLLRKWNVSSNVIEDAVVQNVDTDDAQITWVQVDRGFGQASATNWLFTGPPYFYNEGLTNENVVRRWLGGIPSGLASELGQITGGTFYARKAGVQTLQVTAGTPTASLLQVRFADDYTAPGFDQGNNYGNGTAPGNPVAQVDSFFTAPVAGPYDLSALLDVSATIRSGATDGSITTLQARLRRYDPTGTTLLAQYLGPLVTIDWRPYITNFWNGLYFCKALSDATVAVQVAVDKLGLPCDAGDRVRVDLLVNSFGARFCSAGPITWTVDLGVQASSYFRCTASPDFGNFTQEADPTNFPSVLVKFTAPVGRLELDALLGDLTRRVRVDTQDRSWSGWVEACKYDHASGTAAFTLSTPPRLLP